MASTQRILVIDDDHESGQFITDTAIALGINCLAATDVPTFLKYLSPDTTLIFLDLRMPEVDGIELLRILGEKQCRAGIVLISGVDKRILETAEEWAKARGLTVVGHLQKPYRLSELEGMIETHQTFRASHSVKQTSHFPITADDLKRAIDLDEFVLHYQPQIDIATGEIIGVEALVRWQHPRRGLIFPDDFIRRSEELGLIEQLGWIVMNRSLAQVGEFADNIGTPLMLSINVSAYSLHDLKFPDTLSLLLKKYSVSAENLIFELTESGVIQELSSTLDILTRLRMKDIQLSIDDFGSGYSMLRQLRRVPASELKIDKNFVQNIHIDDRDRILVEKTIEIGHELGLRVVAEGVETFEQLEFLRQKRCDIAQGYFFSRPLPGNELMGWLKNYQHAEGGYEKLALAQS